MTETSPVAPPDTAVWYDLEATTGDVLAILRLTEQDIDVERIKAQVPAAAVLIDDFLDRLDAIPGPPPPSPMQQALNQLTVELYRRKDAPFAMVPPPHILDAVRSELVAHKRRWGVA